MTSLFLALALTAQPPSIYGPLIVYHEVVAVNQRGNPLAGIVVTGVNRAGSPRYDQPVGGVTGRDGKFTFTWKARYANPLDVHPAARVNEDDRLFGGPSVVTFTDPNKRHKTVRAAWQQPFVGRGVDYFVERPDAKYARLVSSVTMETLP